VGRVKQLADSIDMEGDSTRELARIFPERVIHGFDSFEGLPEDWGHLGKGHFEVKGELPDVPANVHPETHVMNSATGAFGKTARLTCDGIETLFQPV